MVFTSGKCFCTQDCRRARLKNSSKKSSRWVKKEGSITYTKYVSALAREMHKQSWIVSGSPHTCVAVIGEKLGIPEHRVLGTIMDEVDGITAPRISAPGIVWEGLKKTVLEGQEFTIPGLWPAILSGTGTCSKWRPIGVGA